MKALKLATLPLAVFATSAYADNIVTETTEFVGNSTTQVVDGAKTLFNKATHPGAISAEIGTLGYGGHITWGVNPKTDLVAGWNGGDFDVDTDIGGNDSIINWNKVLGDNMKDFEGNLALKADLSNPYLGVRLRPWANNFNLNTGVIFNDNKISAVLTNQKTYTHTFKYDVPEYGYTAGQTATFGGGEQVTVSTEQKNTLSPYLTLGFAPSSDKRWGFFGEVGAAYTGDIKTTVSTNTNTSAVNALAEDIRKEVEDSNIKWYPIIKAGVSVRF